jgi:hypothetical protein
MLALDDCPCCPSKCRLNLFVVGIHMTWSTYLSLSSKHCVNTWAADLHVLHLYRVDLSPLMSFELLRETISCLNRINMMLHKASGFV